MNLVIDALAQTRDGGWLTTGQVTKAVNAASPGPDVSHKVVLTILRRLRDDKRVKRAPRGRIPRYTLTRKPDRLR